MSWIARSIVVTFLLANFSTATTPSITVQSPANKSSVTSAVHYVATGSSSQCSKGMAAMQLYSGAGTLV